MGNPDGMRKEVKESRPSAGSRLVDGFEGM